MIKEPICCPLCNAKLRPIGGFWDCPNDHREWAGTKELWQALTQAKQDLENAKADIEDYKKYKALWERIRNNTILELERKLEIARQALEEIRDETGEDRAGFSYVVLAINMKETAEKALEQIEHKE